MDLEPSLKIEQARTGLKEAGERELVAPGARGVHAAEGAQSLGVEPIAGACRDEGRPRDHIRVGQFVEQPTGQARLPASDVKSDKGEDAGKRRPALARWAWIWVPWQKAPGPAHLDRKLEKVAGVGEEWMGSRREVGVAVVSLLPTERPERTTPVDLVAAAVAEEMGRGRRGRRSFITP
ncbi:hypothetical protein Taro_014886 [Colocasia esculenta]|uniref:Uncharacterized protein n=1 Tax=Colocasia esculenta TaxID=4460 RepID=A0A843UN81_COLES|nr:hypothetical protein [Colocasia esculenta]